MAQEGKMILIAILPFLISAVNGFTQFTVLRTPSSLTFDKDSIHYSEDIARIFAGSLGLSVNCTSGGAGVHINDPFNVPHTVVAFIVDGVSELPIDKEFVAYGEDESDTHRSLDPLLSSIRGRNVDIVDVNLAQGLDGVLDDLSNDIDISKESSYGALQPSLHSEDKLFLQQVSVLKQIPEMLSSCGKKPSLALIRLSLEPIITAHGEKSAAEEDAVKLLLTDIKSLVKEIETLCGSRVLFTTITTSVEHMRHKRETKEDEKKDENPLNIAPCYSKDYPVIFNIILWFMVIFVFSLIAICYSIALMDPGRDSIIYRMTSNRMKKDN